MQEKDQRVRGHESSVAINNEVLSLVFLDDCMSRVNYLRQNKPKTKDTKLEEEVERVLYISFSNLLSFLSHIASLHVNLLHYQCYHPL